MFNRIIFICLICLFTSACNPAKPAVDTDASAFLPMTYSLQVEDLTLYETAAPLVANAVEKLNEEGFAAADPKGADVAMKIVLTRAGVSQLGHEGPGRAPILGGFTFDPLSTLVNAAYFVGWAVKETGKAAIDAGTPNHTVTMKLTYVTADNKAYELQQIVGLHTKNEDKSREYLVRVLSDAIVDHMEAIRDGETIEEAVIVENTCVVTTLREAKASADKSESPLQ